MTDLIRGTRRMGRRLSHGHVTGLNRSSPNQGLDGHARAGEAKTAGHEAGGAVDQVAVVAGVLAVVALRANAAKALALVVIERHWGAGLLERVDRGDAPVSRGREIMLAPQQLAQRGEKGIAL